MQPPKPPQEEERLAALARYEILDAPLEDEFEDVTRLIARVCDVPVALISLVDRDRQWFVSEVGLGVRETSLDISICAHAILQPGLFVVPDTQADARFSDNPVVMGDPHLRFYAGALLETSDGYPLGTLCVLDSKTRELTEEQKDILQVLARQVMRQIELRSLLLQQSRAMAEKEQARLMLDAAYEREKRIAETLQRSLLRDVPEQAFPGLDVVSRYEAAWNEAEVGGDFYDAFPVGAGKVALVLGDVAGKGLGAAARTAEVKYALRAFLQEYPHPARTLARLNDFLCSFHDYGTEDTPRFIVVALGVVDTGTGEAIFSIAGAEPPVVLRRDGASETKTGHGLPLGIQPGVEYETYQWRLESGDTLLLATDGLTEARQGDDYLGHAGLIRIAGQAQRAPSLRAMGEAILRDVKAFGGGSLRDYDEVVAEARGRLPAAGPPPVKPQELGRPGRKRERDCPAGRRACP